MFVCEICGKLMDSSEAAPFAEVCVYCEEKADSPLDSLCDALDMPDYGCEGPYYDMYLTT